MTDYKTPEQIGREIAAQIRAEGFNAFLGRETWSPDDFWTHIASQAIEADRAQRTWQVLTGGTSRYPLAIIGAYATKFEAEAVADAWNRVNGQYGIRYRVEEDA